MSHHHNHAHHDHNDHYHEVRSTLSFQEKMIKLFEHWIKHNDDHAQTYRDWAEKAKANHMAAEVETLLKESADMTLKLNKKFEQAIEHIRNK